MNDSHSSKTLIDSLAHFADHNELCPLGQWKPQDEEDFDMPDCACGLNLLLDHAKAFVAADEPPALVSTLFAAIEHGDQEPG